MPKITHCGMHFGPTVFSRQIKVQEAPCLPASILNSASMSSIMNSASMSSSFNAYDAADFLRHSSSDIDMVFSDPSLFPFDGVVHDIPYNQTLHEAPPCLDPLSPPFLSFSPPSTYRANPVQPLLSNGPNFGTEFGNFSPLYGFNGAENELKFMHRSSSTNSFDGNPGFLFQPHNDSFIDSSNFQPQPLSSPENGSYIGQSRKVCSAGGMQQNTIPTQTSPKQGSLNFKVGRYSAEERKKGMSKYRAKRRQRNFNKTIKYACRKTLADNQPRIGGRFARNGEVCENTNAPCSVRNGDEDDLWLRGLLEEPEDLTVKAEQYLNLKGYSPQFQYYGF